MMRIYRQPRYGYWVLAVGRASFRIGRGRSDWRLGVMVSTRGERFHNKVWFIAFWGFRLFLQLDWNLNDGGLR